MGRKLKESSTAVGEAELQQAQPLHEAKAERKKKKKKQKNKDEEEAHPSPNPKRKLEDIAPQEEDSDSIVKKKKKKKKHKKSKDKEEEPENNQEPQENGHADEGESGDAAVAVSGKDSKEAKYKPLTSFAESKLPSEVLQCCQNFNSPSPIQSRAWPFLLDGRDFIGIAKTGSGKTLAFGIPAIMQVLNKRKGKFSRGRTPLCLALAPTRELAQQFRLPRRGFRVIVFPPVNFSLLPECKFRGRRKISDVLFEAGKPCGVVSVCLFGGASKGPQISMLKSGVDIVIGTPGRLKDLIENKDCCLKEVSFTVLDEADRMLDLGFEPEVRYILGQTCSARQMVMFSATWPPSVHQLAQEFMDPNPVKVVVGSEDLAANHDVMQIVEVLDDHSRNGRLVALLEKYHKSQENRVLIFVLYKAEAPRLENMLHRGGWKAVSIHGDKAQSERTKALSLFKKGSCPLMIATDVAARGLDIPDVEVVINYSFPLTTEDYVHRIGRTGRAGKKGVAHTFFTHHNKGLAGELVNVLREAKQNVPEALLKFGTHVKKKESKLYGAHFKEIPADAPKSQKITFNSDDED